MVRVVGVIIIKCSGPLPLPLRLQLPPPHVLLLCHCPHRPQAIGANVALVAAGVYIRVINHAACAACPPGSSDGQLLALRLLLGTVGVVTAIMFAAKAYIDARVLPPPPTPAAALASSAAVTTTTSSTVTASATGGAAAAAAPGTTAAAPAPSAGKRKSKASKGSFAQGLAVLRDNPKVRDLALLVMSYGISHRCAVVLVVEGGPRRSGFTICSQSLTRAAGI